MNAISGSILLTLLLAIAFAPRRWALLAVMAGVFFLTQGHALNVAGLSIFPIRFLEAAAFARVILRRELVWSQLNRVDWILLAAYNYTALVWILRSSELAAEQFAFALDPTLCYLALRGLIGSLDDLRWMLRAFVLLLVPFVLLVSLERVTGETSFALVGANWQPHVREGVARASGPFRHASLLGSVAAALFASYVSLWWRKQDRLVAVAGAAICVGLIVLSHSGGPLTSALAAIAGWVLWSVRDRMRLVRYAIMGTVGLLIAFMEAPIWFLPFKVSQIVGGGGYHRGQLMQSAWNDLDKWWLFGMDIRETVPWFPYVHELVGGADITNEFVTVAIKGGLAALLLLVFLLCRALGDIGRKLQSLRLSAEKRTASEALLWGLGVALVVHAISWLGIGYFDQSWVIWLLHLAAVSASIDAAASPASQPAVNAASPRAHLLRPLPVATAVQYGRTVGAGTARRLGPRPDSRLGLRQRFRG